MIGRSNWERRSALNGYGDWEWHSLRVFLVMLLQDSGDSAAPITTRRCSVSVAVRRDHSVLAGVD